MIKFMSLKKASYILIIISTIFGSMAHASSFDKWKKSYAKKMSKRGLPYHFVMESLSNIELDPVVLEKQNNQIIMDSEVSYDQFIKRWMRESPSRIELGKKALLDNLKLLKKIEKEFGVEKEIIVSLWGVETLYGKILGDYNIVRSLASLAYKGRRKKFFESQLNAALRLVKKGHVDLENFKGSWAGATGHCQFMPSNIPAYAVDYNKDGKIDIWNTKEDVFASIANYLKKTGWKKGLSIGSLAESSRDLNLSLDKYRSKREYHRLGFKSVDGTPIHSQNWARRKAAKIPLKDSPIILRGGNFKAIRRWNRSNLFAAFNILLVKEFEKIEAIN